MLNDTITTAVNNTRLDNATPGHTEIVLTIVSKIVCVVVFTVGLLGNSVVLVVFGSRWSRLKGYEIFIINLALADLIGTIATPSTQFFEIVGADFKLIGNVGCKLIHFSIITSITVSSLTLIGITVDRFVIVKWPLRVRVSFRTLRVVVLLTWVFGSGPGTLYLVGESVKLHRKNDVFVCRMFIGELDQMIHTIVTFSIQVVIPLVIMIVLYSLIIYELWKTTKKRHFLFQKRELRERFIRNKKAIKLLIAIVIMFFACIVPVNTLFILYINGATNLPPQELILLFSIMQMLQMFNSCINPIIYSKFHRSFRRTVVKMFCFFCHQKVRNYQWEDLGENIKVGMSQSMKLMKANLSLFATPLIQNEFLTVENENFGDEINFQFEQENDTQVTKVESLSINVNVQPYFALNRGKEYRNIAKTNLSINTHRAKEFHHGKHVRFVEQ